MAELSAGDDPAAVKVSNYAFSQVSKREGIAALHEYLFQAGQQQAYLK